jgi:hypothetical protein
MMVLTWRFSSDFSLKVRVFFNENFLSVPLGHTYKRELRLRSTLLLCDSFNRCRRPFVPSPFARS